MRTRLYEWRHSSDRLHVAACTRLRAKCTAVPWLGEQPHAGSCPQHSRLLSWPCSTRVGVASSPAQGIPQRHMQFMRGAIPNASRESQCLSTIEGLHAVLHMTWSWVIHLLAQCLCWTQACLRQALSWVMRAGPLPRHVAFIMDGNRRFAQQRHINRIEGHHEGYSRLIDALEWCLELGVTCISVYAFSVENFKRSKTEVDDLMLLAQQKLEQILLERNLVDKHGVQVRVIGELHLLPQEVQRSAARVMAATQHNSNGVLNICFSYTSQHEIAAAVKTVSKGVQAKYLSPGDVNSDVLSQCLHTAECPPVDLLVRTSGETRLSDFLMWQSGHAVLEFTSVLWPEFGFWDLLKAIAHYQRAVSRMCTAMAPSDKMSSASFTPYAFEATSPRVEAAAKSSSQAPVYREALEKRCCVACPCGGPDTAAGGGHALVQTRTNPSSRTKASNPGPSRNGLVDRTPATEFLRYRRAERFVSISSGAFQ